MEGVSKYCSVGDCSAVKERDKFKLDNYYLKQQFDELKEEYDRFIQLCELDKSEDEVKKLIAENSELHIQVSKYQGQINSLTDNRLILLKQVEDWKQKVELNQQSMEEFKSKYQLDREITDKNRALRAVETQHKILIKHNEDLVNQNMLLEQKYKKMVEDYNTMVTLFNRKTDDLKRLEKDLLTLNAELIKNQEYIMGVEEHKKKWYSFKKEKHKNGI